MEHTHSPIVQLDKTIQCRTCGEMLSTAEEEICKVSSSTRARHVLEEIAVAGHYTAIAYHDGFVVYSRGLNDNVREEVTAEKISSRNFRVYKQLLMKEVD